MAHKPPKLNPLQVREALDRTHVITDMVENHLLKHGGVLAVPGAAKKIAQATELLEEAWKELARANMSGATAVKRVAKKSTGKKTRSRVGRSK